MKYLLAGLIGGVIGGMGMGSGTLLIPILTIMLGVGQKSAQLINILSFIPMAILTTVLNAKKGLVKWQYMLYVSLSGTITAIATSFAVDSFDSGILRICFGVFLMVLGTAYIIATIVDIVKKRCSLTLVDINVKKPHGDD